MMCLAEIADAPTHHFEVTFLTQLRKRKVFDVASGRHLDTTRDTSGVSSKILTSEIFAPTFLNKIHLAMADTGIPPPKDNRTFLTKT